MAIIIQQPVPAPVVTLMKKQGVIIKHFTSARSFEKLLLKFLKRMTILRGFKVSTNTAAMLQC